MILLFRVQAIKMERLSLLFSLVSVLIVLFVESNATSAREENSLYGKCKFQQFINLLLAISFVRNYQVKAFYFIVYDGLNTF